jgi:hypothetical protein
MIFFHSGPIAYNGILALYWPAFVFFTWLCVMSSAMIKTLKEDVGVQEVSVEYYT